MNIKETKTKIKILSIKKLLASFKRNIFKKENYLPKFTKKNKMQDGINLDDCKHYISLMYPEENFNIENPSSELIKIEKSI